MNYFIYIFNWLREFVRLSRCLLSHEGEFSPNRDQIWHRVQSDHGSGHRREGGEVLFADNGALFHLLL